VTIKFEKVVPDLTPDEVKEILSSVLDFSKKSATKTFIESVPDEFKDAVKSKQAAVGMDKELVLATLGRPLKKVREKKGEVQTEDWIYGERPQKVTFVTFLNGKVISVKEY
jgi:O-methyltransferase involved in polyketide biosynthesis